MLCAFIPSHRRLKFAKTVYDTEIIGDFPGLIGQKGQKQHFLALFFTEHALNLACKSRALLNRDKAMVELNQ